MEIDNFAIQGLSDQQVVESRAKHGANRLEFKKENPFLDILKSLVKEPMVLLLLVASAIYFISGDIGDGIFLAVAIVLVASISLYQDSRSRNALEKLKTYTQANVKVIRGPQVVEIKSEELVIGDRLIVEEGNIIPADGNIIHSNDFSVNESILTGESLSIYKDSKKEDHTVYQGTTVASGLAVVTINAIGHNTTLGKIGKSMEEIEEEETPLEIQIGDFVKKMVIAGAIIFLLVWGINYFISYDLLDSLLNALTLAMSVLPEEIPVAFTTFMAIGAWRMMKKGIIVKQMKTIETLGIATIICVDKTGTITKNEMSLAKFFVYDTGEILDPTENFNSSAEELLQLSMWSSEPIPFDPMEIALHETYAKKIKKDERPFFKMIHEYPLGGKPPMMTHLFENETGKRIIAAKGAPEALLAVSNLNDKEKEGIRVVIQNLAKKGYRLLGVGTADFTGDDFPKRQQDFDFQFKGLVAFYDPPKENIQEVFETFNKAGIDVKIITGDNAETTASIAKQINFKNHHKSMSGDELMQLDDASLQKKVLDTQVFTRMFPDAKLRIINALKNSGEIVAMTGDGVNDGPALKAAHIGIAMGKRGTEIAKQASSLILVEDDLSKMVDAVATGRKIYTNLKKAIRYIISIHIPIILTVFIPLALGWIYPNIFSPVHVILLELIMGPTCSIIYENEPMEKNTMIQKPRPLSLSFFNWSELTMSVIQGLMITAGAMLAYQFAVQNGYGEAATRTMVFTVLVMANIFLTLVNRSFDYSIFTTLKYKNNLVPLIIGITLVMLGLMLFVPVFTSFLGFEQLGIDDLLRSAGIGFLSVMWFEIWVIFKKKNIA